MLDRADLKRCSTCKRDFPLEEGFHKDKHSLDGYCYRCKDCANAYVADWQRNPAKKEEKRARDRLWVQAKRRALRLEREQKVTLFVRQLEGKGWTVVERRIGVHETTTLLVLERDGQTERLDMRRAKI